MKCFQSVNCLLKKQQLGAFPWTTTEPRVSTTQYSQCARLSPILFDKKQILGVNSKKESKIHRALRQNDPYIVISGKRF